MHRFMSGKVFLEVGWMCEKSKLCVVGVLASAVPESWVVGVGLKVRGRDIFER